MEIEEGIALYTIERDGCLTGVYSNTGLPKDALYNEIARKAENAKGKIASKDIEGEYTCSWVDIKDEIVKATLTIEWKSSYYEVKWLDAKASTILFQGKGFKMGNHTFAVYYTK